MIADLEQLLARARGAGPTPRPVPEVDVLRLEAELGRPLPAILKLLWSSFGAGRLGALALDGAREISRGLAMAERWLDDGLLPIGLSDEGPVLVRLDEAEDPQVIAASDFPPPSVRNELGPLSEAARGWALAALKACPAIGPPRAGA